MDDWVVGKSWLISEPIGSIAFKNLDELVHLFDMVGFVVAATLVIVGIIGAGGGSIAAIFEKFEGSFAGELACRARVGSIGSVGEEEFDEFEFGVMASTVSV